MDYDNPEIEERWCNERRNEVIAYLKGQNLVHGQVSGWPAWHVAPYVSIWEVESKSNPGWLGWWAVAGDLPTDYVSAGVIKHPRDAVKAFAMRWRAAAEHMARGKAPPGFRIGTPAEWPSLGPQLTSRAELFQSWAANPELWANI